MATDWLGPLPPPQRKWDWEKTQPAQPAKESMPRTTATILDIARRLDLALTGKATNYHQRDRWNTADSWIGDSFYLSDGGYSRLFLSLETGSILLDSVSRREVKERWNSEEARTLRGELEQRLIAELDPRGEYFDTSR